jgi:hypothetical protein
VVFPDPVPPAIPITIGVGREVIGKLYFRFWELKETRSPPAISTMGRNGWFLCLVERPPGQHDRSNRNGLFDRQDPLHGLGGETLSASGAIPTDKQYTGQTKSSNSGLYFYNARW